MNHKTSEERKCDCFRTGYIHKARCPADYGQDNKIPQSSQTSEDTIGYTKVPSSLSLAILRRTIGDKETDALIKKYVTERNRTMKKRGAFCPHCGGKLPIIK